MQRIGWLGAAMRVQSLFSLELISRNDGREGS